jgi:hypothetical protein
MKASKNSEKSSDNKSPGLKCRYSQGLGDLIACILHSKYIGWLTHRITGLDAPCEMCSRRAEALNILFPISFWKLFFKSEEKLRESLIKDLKASQFEIQIDQQGGIYATKTIESPLAEEPPKIDNNPPNKENYVLMGNSDNYIGEFLIQTSIFKLK